MTSYPNKLVTCPTASAELRAFSIAAFGRGQSNFAALIYVVITGSNAQSYAEPLPSRWTVSGASPEHSKAFMGVAVMSRQLRANWQTLLLHLLLHFLLPLLPLRHQNSLQVWRRETAALLPPVLLLCNFNVDVFSFFFFFFSKYLRNSICALKYVRLPPLLVATA